MIIETKKNKKCINITHNRKARFNYFIKDIFETGIILHGSEVKSLRNSKVSIQESYAEVKKNEVWLINVNIPHYQTKMPFAHSPSRPRKLLLHYKEIYKMINTITKKGFTLVPLKLYFNIQSIVKVELALVQGKNKTDKRQVIKNRDWKRQQSRLINKSYL